ncbi:MAG: ASCH domain-containing protein [Clostridia bacterium]|nr:ASCH domain-containing protein [Clostridia bacterium]
MKFYMNLQKEPFHLIKSGVKIYELRLYDEKRKGIKIGDEIEFSLVGGNEESILVSVVDLKRYSSFIDLYADLSPLEIGYTAENFQLASPLDMEKYYSKEQVAKSGVLAIKIALKSR